MANPDAPFGFKAIGHTTGGTPARLPTTKYRLSTAYNTALFEGDVVKTDGSGNINIAAAGDAIIGVFKGVNWIAQDGSVKYSNNWVASTAEKSGTVIEALVVADPNLLFEVQSDGTMTRADIGQLVDIDTSQSGDAATGISRQQTSATGGAESQFVIVDVIEDKPIRNAAGNQDMLTTGLNARVIVKPAKHELAGAATAVEL